MEGNQKYREIVSTAHRLFWKFGIRRVTIEEICKEAGVSKMTFYRFFSNKIEIAKKVLSTIFDDAELKYKEIMSQDISFPEKVKQQVRLKFEGTKEISQEIIADISSNWNEELQLFYMGYVQKMTNMVYEDYANAKDHGEIREDVNLDFVFYMSKKMAQMAAEEELSSLYPSMQDVIMEFMNMLFYGILPRK